MNLIGTQTAEQKRNEIMGLYCCEKHDHISRVNPCPACYKRCSQHIYPVVGCLDCSNEAASVNTKPKVLPISDELLDDVMREVLGGSNKFKTLEDLAAGTKIVSHLSVIARTDPSADFKIQVNQLQLALVARMKECVDGMMETQVAKGAQA